MDNSLGEADT
jgi:hypothetical protein